MDNQFTQDKIAVCNSLDHAMALSTWNSSIPPSLFFIKK